jgi:hypothetical protein
MFYWQLESQIEEWITNLCGKVKLELNWFELYFSFSVSGMNGCNEWKTEKCHECTNIAHL